MAHDGAATPLLVASPKPRRNMYAFACATLASMTVILMGYNLALMSGAQLFIREDLGLSDAQIEVLAGSMNVYMLVSVVASGWLTDLLGRRGMLVLANAFLMAGALAMSLGRSYAALMAARFVTSIGAGFSSVSSSVYNAEISPIFLNVGVLLSYVSNYAFAGMPVRLGWRVMFAVGVLPPVLLAVGALAMPESPRWLVMRGRYGDARTVLVRTSDAPADADLRLEEIKHAVEAAPQPGGVWKELLGQQPASVRRILVCVVGLQMLQQLSGIDAILLYSPLVFKKAGMSSTNAVLGATVAIGVVKTCSIFVASFLSDRVGRRPLLLASTAAVAAALVSLALALCVGAETVCVASVLAIVAVFSVGLGPLVGTYSVEILPLRLRAQGASLGGAVNRLTCGVVSMTFISLAGAITMPGCFFLYAGAAAAGCAFVYTRVPETRGRSLEDMYVLFADRQ
ncbi:hypothetical protein ACP70R_022769 [Stipagrostis hirtigluma subsp. patula]